MRPRLLPFTRHIIRRIVSILKASLSYPQKYISQGMTVFVGSSPPSVTLLIIISPSPCCRTEILFYHGLSLDTDESPKISRNLFWLLDKPREA
jgi:hypothetical protein